MGFLSQHAHGRAEALTFQGRNRTIALASVLSQPGTIMRDLLQHGRRRMERWKTDKGNIQGLKQRQHVALHVRLDNFFNFAFRGFSSTAPARR